MMVGKRAESQALTRWEAMAGNARYLTVSIKPHGTVEELDWRQV